MKNKFINIHSAAFWDSFSRIVKHRPYYVPEELGQYKQWEFLRRLDQWLPAHMDVCLKTDMFEEAFGHTSIFDLLRTRGRVALGIDISAGILALARRHAPNGGGYFIASDLAKLPFKDASLDVIFSTSTYGYLTHVEQGLLEAHRVLKPGATMIISVNNRHNLFFRGIASFSKYIRLSGVPFSRFYGRAQFRSLLEGAGFRVECCQPAVHVLPGYNLIFSILSRCDGPISRKLCAWLIAFLKGYSIKCGRMKYLTSWFVVFKVSKVEDSALKKGVQ